MGHQKTNHCNFWWQYLISYAESENALWRLLPCAHISHLNEMLKLCFVLIFFNCLPPVFSNPHGYMCYHMCFTALWVCMRFWSPRHNASSSIPCSSLNIQEEALSSLQSLTATTAHSSCFYVPESSSHPANTPITPTATQVSGMSPLSSHDCILCISAHTWIQDNTQYVSADRLVFFFSLNTLQLQVGPSGTQL